MMPSSSAQRQLQKVLQHTTKVLHAFQMLGRAWQQVLWVLVWYVGQTELTPVAIGELIPEPTCHNLRFRSDLLVLATTILWSTRLIIVFTGTVPSQEAVAYGTTRGRLLPILLQVESIHLGRKAPLPPIESNHISRLRRIQQDV